MKTKFYTIIILFSLLVSNVQAEGVLSPTQSVPFGGHIREYAVYTPKDYNTKNTAGLLICLHGLGQDLSIFFNEYNITYIADVLNMVIIAPNALPEQDQALKDQISPLLTMAGISLSFESVWGAGLGIKAPSIPLFLPSGMDVELNKNIDDTAFIDYLVEQILTGYDKINPQDIFISGVSLGAYMSYQYAMTKGDKLAGLISIAGTMGTKIDARTSTKEIPICDFHSVDDNVVPYTGSITALGSLSIAIGTPKETVINNWINWNSAEATPMTYSFPDANDKTVTKYTYPGDNEVIHYQITGADHQYFFQNINGDAMDYYNEIRIFIHSHLSYGADIDAIIQPKFDIITVYPNPAQERIYTGLTQGIISVYDLSGRQVLHGNLTQGSFEVASLTKGFYMVKIETSTSVLIGKFRKD